MVTVVSPPGVTPVTVNSKNPIGKATPSKPGGVGTCRLELEGKSTQGGLLFGHAEPGARVHVGRKPIRVSSDGRFLIPLRRGALPSVTLRIEFADGAVLERELQIEQRDFDGSSFAIPDGYRSRVNVKIRGEQ